MCFSRPNIILAISQVWLVRLMWNEKQVHGLDAFDLTHDLDLGCFKVKFQNRCISGIVSVIDVKWKGSESIGYTYLVLLFLSNGFFSKGSSNCNTWHCFHFKAGYLQTKPFVANEIMEWNFIPLSYQFAVWWYLHFQCMINILSASACSKCELMVFAFTLRCCPVSSLPRQQGRWQPA